MRYSKRVDWLSDKDLKKSDIRVCPMKDIETLINFGNFYPLKRGPKTKDDEQVVPHPKDWDKVTTVQQWQSLPIGAELFVKYNGVQTDGWFKGYYLVNKR